MKSIKPLFVTVPRSEWGALTRKRIKYRGAMKDDRTLDVRQALEHLRRNPAEPVKIPLEPLKQAEAERRRHLVLIYAERCGMKVRTVCAGGFVYIGTPRPADARPGRGGHRALEPAPAATSPRRYFQVTTAQEMREWELRQRGRSASARGTAVQ